MNGAIHLPSYENTDVWLSEADAQFIESRVGNKVRIRRTIDRNSYTINSQQHVGILALPSGRRLTFVPRISATNILYMLAVAYRFPSPFFAELENFEDLTEILEPVAEFFTELVEDQVRSGLYRAYVDAEENLRVVRGRIDFSRDLIHNSVLRHRVYCQYSELTWDIAENQIIRYVCHMLSGWRFRRTDLRKRLVGLDYQLDEVSPRSFIAADTDSFAYHRLNEPYRRVHKLCALLLESASLSEAAGMTEFRTFLLDMNALFELFITQALLDRKRLAWDVSSQARSSLGEFGKVSIRPDLLVTCDGVSVAVADCKYKRVAADSEYVNHDYYQVLAYCIALNVRRATLIYPKHELSLNDEVQIRHSDVVIRRLSIDLQGTPDDMRAGCDRLAGEIFNLPSSSVKASS